MDHHATGNHVRRCCWAHGRHFGRWWFCCSGTTRDKDLNEGTHWIPVHTWTETGLRGISHLRHHHDPCCPRDRTTISIRHHCFRHRGDHRAPHVGTHFGWTFWLEMGWELEEKWSQISQNLNNKENDEKSKGDGRFIWARFVTGNFLPRRIVREMIEGVLVHAVHRGWYVHLQGQILWLTVQVQGYTYRGDGGCSSVSVLSVKQVPFVSLAKVRQKILYGCNYG